MDAPVEKASLRRHGSTAGARCFCARGRITPGARALTLRRVGGAESSRIPDAGA